VANVNKHLDRDFISLSLPSRYEPSVSTENFVTRYVNLTFSVLEPPFTPEMIKDFKSSYGTLISY
jgi:hypothetical protein